MLDELNEGSQSVLEQKADRLSVLYYEGALHESIGGVLDKLPKVYHQAPWVGSVRLKALEQDSRDLFLDYRLLAVHKQRDQNKAEKESVGVGVPELIDYAVQEAETSFIIEFVHYQFEKILVFVLSWLLSLPSISESLLGDVQHYCIDDCRVRNNTPVDFFLRTLHLGADVSN